MGIRAEKEAEVINCSECGSINFQIVSYGEEDIISCPQCGELFAKLTRGDCENVH